MQHSRSRANLDNHVDQQATVGSHDDSATHDIKTDDRASKDSHVAFSDNDEAQDVTHNIAHKLTHCNTLSHTITEQLSEGEQQNLQSLSSPIQGACPSRNVTGNHGDRRTNCLATEAQVFWRGSA